jgi:L-alanine-DL-glutamate epimerase-like enolase superfamily enzyme
MKGQLAREPLWRLLGGARNSIGVYASAINLHLTEEQLVAQIKGNIADGYNAFKLKVGRRDLREDISRCRAVRDVIGSNRQLMLDANQKWGVGEAAQRCQILSEVSPMFVEEPLLSDDVAGHRQLRLTGGIPVAMGEQLCNRYEFWNYVRAEAADFLQPDAWKVGGVTEWMKIATLAETANIELSPHGSIEITAHLAAAVPNALHIENIFGLSLHELGATKAPMPINKGVWQLDDKPGHGIVWDGPNLTAEYEVMPGAAIKREALIHTGL